MRKFYLLLSLLTFTLVFTSCNKDETEPAPTTAKVTVSTSVQDYGTIAGVSVTLLKSSDEVAVATKTTGTDGKVTFTDIAPGIYFVDAIYTDNFDVDYSNDTDDFSLVAGDDKAVSLNLTED